MKCVLHMNPYSHRCQHLLIIKTGPESQFERHTWNLRKDLHSTTGPRSNVVDKLSLQEIIYLF